jgi:hypothetical protein
VSVVPVNPAGVVVPCGGLMLQCERHGRGGDAPASTKVSRNRELNGVRIPPATTTVMVSLMSVSGTELPV